MYFFWRTVVLVHFIDHHTRLQTKVNRLLKHKTGLWHRPFKGIYQQQNPVGHVQNTLYLTTKIGVTRGIYNVDFSVFVNNGNVFGYDSDPTLPFQVVVVQNKVAFVLVFTEQLAVVHNFIDQGSLTVVYVSNYCDVFNFGHNLNFKPAKILLFFIGQYTQMLFLSY